MLFTVLLFIIIVSITPFFFTAVTAIVHLRVDALHVDMLDVVWQVFGPDQHVGVLTFKVILQRIKGCVLGSFRDGTIPEPCGDERCCSSPVKDLLPGRGFTCGLAVIIAILIREADSVFVASVFVVAFNLTHAVFFFTLTFLTAVAGVPLLIELGETSNRHKRLDEKVLREGGWR